MPETSYLARACQRLNLDPDAILAFRAYVDHIALITAEGKKFTFYFAELQTDQAPTSLSSGRAPTPDLPGGVGAAAIETVEGQAPMPAGKTSGRAPTSDPITPPSGRAPVPAAKKRHARKTSNVKDSEPPSGGK